jgi:hypothetical protein
MRLFVEAVLLTTFLVTAMATAVVDILLATTTIHDLLCHALLHLLTGPSVRSIFTPVTLPTSVGTSLTKITFLSSRRQLLLPHRMVQIRIGTSIPGLRTTSRVN